MNEGSLKQKIVENIKNVDSILVTVSLNPSVDELASALALTMFLNDLGKHATAVVSGEVPQTMNFLEPEKTFESSIDSLRDFVISLDKEKADHLRYKVDGDVVKIFITPYRTVISDKDLDYSQGDYNVEMVLAVGVNDQDHLDKALADHGRILHDAVVATVGLDPSSLGSLDYSDSTASSLSELAAGLIVALVTDEKKMSEQVASALLTGIVSATERFSNEHTTSSVMTVAAKLMAAGANQQLIAAKLREGSKLPISSEDSPSNIQKIDKKRSDNEQKNDPTRDRKKKKRGLSIEHSGAVAEDGSGEDAVDDVANISDQSDASAALLDAAIEKTSQELPPVQTSTPEEALQVAPDQDIVEDAPVPEETAAPDETPVVDETSVPPVESASDNAIPESTGEEILSEQLEAVGAVNTPQIPNLDEQLQQEIETTPVEDITNLETKPFEFIPAPVEGNISQSIGISDQHGTIDDKDIPEPSFGGVLNATTEQAADDKRIMKEESRNRTILSHGSTGYVGDTGVSSDSPINGATIATQEPAPVDIFSQPPASISLPTMPSFEPPVPPNEPQDNQQSSLPQDDFTTAPTLADIDQYNRQQDPNTALQAVEDIYSSIPQQTPQPIITPSMQAVQQGLPPLPTMPVAPVVDMPNGISTPPPPPLPNFGGLPPVPESMPDFSQLPPLPGSNEQLPPDNLGQILPPTQPIQQPPAPSDPGQFRLPGQQ
jgi:hypothetical protein